MMPVMGNLTLVVAAMSHAGQLNLTATAGGDSCPALEVFAHGARSALNSLIPPDRLPSSPSRRHGHRS
jgi:diacylglycerol O-acyltransferase / wax synthase